LDDYGRKASTPAWDVIMHHFLIAVIASGSLSAIVTAGIAWRWGITGR